MVKKVMVTGGAGVLGSAFIKYLESLDDLEIYAPIYKVQDKKFNERFILSIKPDYFINCAAISYVPENSDGNLSLEINALSVFDQLNCISEHLPQCRYLNCGSILEKSEEATNYKLSKAVARKFVEFFREKGIYAIQPYLGSFVSKKQKDNFLLPKIIKGAKNIKEKLLKNQEITPMEFGNINNYKSYMDVETAVVTLWDELNEEIPKDFLVMSEETYLVRDIILKVFHQLGLQNSIWIAPSSEGKSPDLFDEILLGGINEEKHLLATISKDLYRPNQNFWFGNIQNVFYGQKSLDKIIHSLIEG